MVNLGALFALVICLVASNAEALEAAKFTTTDGIVHHSIFMSGRFVQATLTDRDASIIRDADQDLDLQRRVVSFLADCHMPGLRQVAVDAQKGVVTLSGRVRTYYEKQIGQQRGRRVGGVVKLVDRVDVA